MSTAALDYRRYDYTEQVEGKMPWGRAQRVRKKTREKPATTTQPTKKKSLKKIVGENSFFFISSSAKNVDK